jgi:hypothetical protein
MPARARTQDVLKAKPSAVGILILRSPSDLRCSRHAPNAPRISGRCSSTSLNAMTSNLSVVSSTSGNKPTRTFSVQRDATRSSGSIPVARAPATAASSRNHPCAEPTSRMRAPCTVVNPPSSLRIVRKFSLRRASKPAMRTSVSTSEPPIGRSDSHDPHPSHCADHRDRRTRSPVPQAMHIRPSSTQNDILLSESRSRATGCCPASPHWELRWSLYRQLQLVFVIRHRARRPSGR